MAYEFNGIEYPSVTTITGILDKPALLSWASNCAVDFIQENLDAIKDPIDVHRGEDVLEEARKAYAQKRDDAGAHGTKTHKAIEMYITGKEGYLDILDTIESQTGFKAFLSWEEKNHVIWLETECAVYSQSVGVRSPLR